MHDEVCSDEVGSCMMRCVLMRWVHKLNRIMKCKDFYDDSRTM